MQRLLIITLALFLAACAAHCPTPPPAPCPVCPVVAAPEKPDVVSARYVPVQFSDLAGWPGDQLVTSWPAWLQSCKRLGKRSDWQTICADAALLTTVDEKSVRDFFEKRFVPWQILNVTGNKPPVDTGMITGYYEPLLTGGREEKPGRVPLYAVPDDMLTVDLGELFPELKGKRVRGRIDGKKVLPYWDRAQIDQGKAQAKVLVWVDEPVDAFFLQIQGSGRVQLEDGSILRVGYADQNGHPYKAIGRWLADQGELPIEKVSMQNIRAWGQAHPERLHEMLNVNPSYVFFRVLENADGGPIGALNVPLTDGASIAVDPKFIPLGSPVFLAATRPDNGAPLLRLMHAQDTGGAIRGPVRADFFWGFGAEAGAIAGMTKQQGRLWLLLPKGVNPPATP